MHKVDVWWRIFFESKKLEAAKKVFAKIKPLLDIPETAKITFSEYYKDKKQLVRVSYRIETSSLAECYLDFSKSLAQISYNHSTAGPAIYDDGGFSFDYLVATHDPKRLCGYNMAHLTAETVLSG
tara:strand:- start:435 stop:809 length:375 start_codon:yes stop_codon:yes gene_type:complete